MLKNFALILLLFSFSSCALFKSTPQKKFDQAQKTEQKAKNAITDKQGEIEDRGKAFIFGAKYSNEQETNRTKAVNLSHDFLDLATMTFGPPSIKDSDTIKDIADGLLSKYARDAVEANNARIQSEKDLKTFINQTSNLQKEKGELIEVYEKKLIASGKLNEQNASKASQWDEENTGFAQFNIFRDIGKLFKKLIMLGLIVGVLVVGFHILEIFFPGLKIISFVMGFFSKIALKLGKSSKQFAGVVSDKVFTTLKMTVKGLDEVLNKVKNYPIEQELVQNYPDTYQFNKKEVIILLEQLSEKIDIMIRGSMDKHQDDEAKAVITVAKAENSNSVVPGLRLI